MHQQRMLCWVATVAGLASLGPRPAPAALTVEAAISISEQTGRPLLAVAGSKT